MSHAFDAERLVSSLPFRPLTAHENLFSGFIPPAWPYSLLGSYNGFSGDERVRTWQVVTWLRKRGFICLAPRCDLCQGSSRLALHSEDYADLERALTTCTGCHFSLHKRFRYPEAWRRKLSSLERPPEWALALDTNPIDLRDWLQSAGAPITALERLHRRFPDDRSITDAMSICAVN